MAGSPFITVTLLLFTATLNVVICQQLVFTSLRVCATPLAPEFFSYLSVNGKESVRLNGPEAVRYSIPASSQLLYNGGTNTLALIAFNPSSLSANTYQYLLQDYGTSPFHFQEFTSGNNVGENGPGTLFYDRETALFVNSASALRLINSLSLPEPIILLPQVEVRTERRSGTPDQLVLNLDTSPDGTDESADDVIKLTGSRVFLLQSSESLTFSSNTLRYRTGSQTQERFENVNTFYTLEDVHRNGQYGRRLQEFSSSAGSVFSGPGSLRVGEFQGQRVALFSTSFSANQQILSESVNEQLIFDSQPETNTAQVSDIFTTPGTSRPLVELSESRTTTYPTATQVNYNNGEVTVQDRFGQRLARTGSASSPLELNAYINHEITSLSGSGSRSFNIPPGGVTLVENQGQAFIYPSRNPLINDGIADARGRIVEPSPPGIRIILTSLPNGHGVLLMGNDQDLVTVTSGTTVDLRKNQSFSYDGSTVSVFNQRSPTTPFLTFPVDSLSVSESANSLLTFDSTTGLNRDVSGPGRLYVDDQNHAFFTDSERRQRYISDFIKEIPPARVLTRLSIDITNGNRVVNVENGGRRLVEVSTATFTNRGPRQGLLYTDSTVNTVNGFRVPRSSTVSYNPSTTPGRSTVNVVSSSGAVTFSTPASTFGYRQGGVLQPAPSVNTNYTGGGVLYFNPETGGVLYNDDDTVTTGLVSQLRGSSNVLTDEPTRNVDELNFFDGRRVTRFIGSANSFLSGPGVAYTSGNQTFYSTDSALNDQVPRDVGQLLPVSVTTNTSTGGVSVTTGTGDPLFNFTVSNTVTGRLSRTGRVTYSNGVVFTPTVFSMNTTGITSFTTFDGLNTRRFGPDDEVTFAGLGQLLIDKDSGEALFATDETIISRINQAIDAVRDTFVRPNIPDPGTPSVTSKFSNVVVNFGQMATVYEGATVNIRCRSSGSPAPMFTFCRNDTLINNTDITDKFTTTMVSLFESILTITGVARDDATRYTCCSQNDIGRDFAFTDLRVRTAEPPVINNAFFPVSTDRPGITITARTTDPPYTRTVVIGNRDSMVPLASTANIVSTANIACKADGRPKATITWSRSDNMPINESNVVVPREGRSILTVEFDPSNTNAVTFSCEASNEGGDANARVLVAPESYRCEYVTPEVECSVTCGSGVQWNIPANCDVDRNGIVTPIDLADTPSGLFTPRHSFTMCMAGACPVTTFEFDDELEFGECSRSCNSGLQRRELSCYVVVDGVRSNMATNFTDCFNSRLELPVQEQTCNNFECPRWVVQSEFSQCSSMCAGGTRQRDVACMQRIPVLNETTSEPLLDANGDPVTNDTQVEDDLCLSVLVPRRMEACNTLTPCPHRWYPGPWEECDVDYCQVRNIICERYDPSDPSERRMLDDSECLEPRLHEVRDCGGGRCDRGNWMAAPFDMASCSVTCGFGSRSRDVSCVSRDDPLQVISEGFCLSSTMPNSVETCLLFNCPGRCEFEPGFCRVLSSLRLCETERFPSIAEPCCMSCPLQATPIIFPPTVAPSQLSVGLDMAAYSVTMGEDLEVCCVTSSSTNADAFVSFNFPCTFSAKIAGEAIERSVSAGRRLDNRHCVTFPTSTLGLDDSFELTLNSDFGGANANVTVIMAMGR